MKFQAKKRKIIEANQWFEGRNTPGVFATHRTANDMVPTGRVKTIQGQIVTIHEGEWVVDEGDGEHFYPIADDVFKETYEPLGRNYECPQDDANCVPLPVSEKGRELHELIENAAQGTITKLEMVVLHRFQVEYNLFGWTAVDARNWNNVLKDGKSDTWASFDELLATLREIVDRDTEVKSNDK